MAWAIAIPLITSLISTGLQLYGQDKSNKEAAKARDDYQRQLTGRIDDLNAWFNKENSKDFLDTDIARSTIRGLTGNIERQTESLNNASVQGGLTPEANIAAKGKLDEGFSDAIAKLLGYGTQYKQQLRNNYDYRLQSLYQPMNELAVSRINDWGNYQQNLANAGNAVSSAVGSIDWEQILNNPGTTTT